LATSPSGGNLFYMNVLRGCRVFAGGSWPASACALFADRPSRRRASRI